MKLAHFIWDKTPMSFLTVCSVLSFINFHPDWNINIWTLDTHLSEKKWTTCEHKNTTNWKDYFYYLTQCNNVNIKKLNEHHDLSHTGYTSVQLVDYVKYLIISQYGGVYIDFDILFFANMCNSINIDNTTLFVMENYRKPYIPTAFLISKKNSLFYTKITNDCPLYYDPNYYQTFGTNMLNNLLFTKKKMSMQEIHNVIENKYQENVTVCNARVYLPIEWSETHKIFSRSNLTTDYLKTNFNAFGLHWFAGDHLSTSYRENLDNKIKEYTDTGIFEKNCIIDDLIIEYIEKITK